jgi:uncharacterized protein
MSARTWNPSVTSRRCLAGSTRGMGCSPPPGNYDSLLGLDLIRSQLVAQSIEFLVNRGLHVGPSDGRLFLAALDSVCTGAPDPIRAFAGCRETDTALALVHEPDCFPTMVKLTPVQLQLSGHSHGGQVWIPALGPLILPRLSRIYHTGLYKLNGRFVYTGRGLGMVDCRCDLIVCQSSRSSHWRQPED